MAQFSLKSLNLPCVKGEEDLVKRILDLPLSREDFLLFETRVKHLGVTERFKDVIRTFSDDPNNSPAGFRRELELCADNVLRVDLVRDISYAADGEKRSTGLLFSADSANPYEVEPMKDLIANLTCNPGIIYDLFINNPKANIGNKFKNRDEVMTELARILGPGVDISVELNNPFEKDFDAILEEAAKFKEMLNPYRVVIKVPHTGPVNADNVHELMEGNKRLSTSYKHISTEDAFRSHNLVYRLQKLGYRINYTLMFEPYQTQLALQARPYFINTFLRQRYGQSQTIDSYLKAYEATGQEEHLKNLKQFFIDTDHFSDCDMNASLLDVLQYAKHTLAYRNYHGKDGLDGLDAMRHSLRCLRGCNLPDTRLIICSMEGEENYPDIDKLLCENEFIDMQDKVVITTEPNYFARFTSTNQVITYQRRFMNAAKGQK